MLSDQQWLITVTVMFDRLGANPFLAESAVFTDFKGWGGGRDAGKYGVFTVTIRDDGLVQDQWLRLQGFFLRCVTTSRLFL